MKNDVIKYNNLIGHIVSELNESTGEEYSFRTVTRSSYDVFVSSDGSFSDQPSSTDYYVIAKKDIPDKLLIDAVDLCFRYQKILRKLKGTDSETERKRAEIRKLLDSSVSEMVGNFVYCYSGYFSTRGYSYSGGANSSIELDSSDNYFKYINPELLDKTIVTIKTTQKNSIRRKLTRRYY